MGLEKVKCMLANAIHNECCDCDKRNSCNGIGRDRENGIDGVEEFVHGAKLRGIRVACNIFVRFFCVQGEGGWMRGIYA